MLIPFSSALKIHLTKSNEKEEEIGNLVFKREFFLLMPAHHSISYQHYLNFSPYDFLHHPVVHMCLNCVWVFLFVRPLRRHLRWPAALLDHSSNFPALYIFRTNSWKCFSVGVIVCFWLWRLVVNNKLTLWNNCDHIQAPTNPWEFPRIKFFFIKSNETSGSIYVPF